MINIRCKCWCWTKKKYQQIFTIWVKLYWRRLICFDKSICCCTKNRKQKQGIHPSVKEQSYFVLMMFKCGNCCCWISIFIRVCLFILYTISFSFIFEMNLFLFCFVCRNEYKFFCFRYYYRVWVVNVITECKETRRTKCNLQCYCLFVLFCFFFKHCINSWFTLSR